MVVDANPVRLVVLYPVFLQLSISHKERASQFRIYKVWLYVRKLNQLNPGEVVGYILPYIRDPLGQPTRNPPPKHLAHFLLPADLFTGPPGLRSHILPILKQHIPVRYQKQVLLNLTIQINPHRKRRQIDHHVLIQFERILEDVVWD